MIQENVLNNLAEHIKNEYEASYAYKSYYISFKLIGLNGFAHWFHENSEEENEHAEKIIDYLIDRNFYFDLQDVSLPATTNLSLIEIKENIISIFESVYDLELKVTNQINDLMNMAIDQRDNATIEFLGWYITEQQDSLKVISDIINKLKIADECGVLFIDKCLMNKSLNFGA